MGTDMWVPGHVTTLLAIDPGATSGWARFHGEVLDDAGKFDFVAVEGIDFSLPQSNLYCGGQLVIEIPRVYPRSGKGDPNDIIELAMKAGEIRGYYRHLGMKVREVYPRTWKGTVPKDVHGARVLAALTDIERSLLEKVKVTKTNANGYNHNELDAVGLGLWHLKRM